ncbi:GGDEF domain-containing protein [Pseudoalteromonas ruthenica]|uniref:GGDEF domain-containing protein n=1 Tax=Pseudoalteromonas ruthenica TaxID=151081 RepID=UPI0008DCE63D|nr:GGDEF domain-containing protein [Pseudoalteromonas ruthenica]TMO85516.1 GGDEF domain-containing protein [Pseudoalteromonas ruthenica]TMO92799.1 GGDEF domain-containing protein [Pseudoalteromonas ruthenica]TMO97735.1 GGDEF domain-containing protein [Pseudoalteromonas ruthenica]TMP04032.1 GGDEF domain-containing protein [Pseudoalteromonas ruthenica]TMP09232.1 GGDEF domain-containing protein [Pseudoalteromonas ruthenica]
MDNVHILTYANTQSSHDQQQAASFCRPQSAVNVVALTQQLQRSLEVVVLLDTFAQFVAPYASFDGLQLHSSLGVSEMSNSRNTSVANRFDIDVEQEHLGQLVYYSHSPFSDQLCTQLKQWHQILSYPLRNALTYNRVLRLATRDPLTGLNNRSDFNIGMEKKLEVCRRQNRPFSLMLLDLDNFKQVNDQQGHQVGDETLQEFAMILKSSVRGTDSVFRFGGDEFAVLIDDDDFDTNQVVAERVQKAVHANALMARHGVTSSIGYALAEAKDSSMSLFARADKALYQAKNLGRDTHYGEPNSHALERTNLNTHNSSQNPEKNAKIS